MATAHAISCAIQTLGLIRGGINIFSPWPFFPGHSERTDPGNTLRASVENGPGISMHQELQHQVIFPMAFFPGHSERKDPGNTLRASVETGPGISMHQELQHQVKLYQGRKDRMYRTEEYCLRFTRTYVRGVVRWKKRSGEYNIKAR